MDTRQVLTITLPVALLLLIGGIPIVLQSVTEPNVPADDTLTPPAPPEPVPEPQDPEPPVISKQVFDKLLFGMTYRQVTEALGSESNDIEKEYKRRAGPYESTKLILWYTWKNPDGSKVRVGFANDQLIEKYESDLQ